MLKFSTPAASLSPQFSERPLFYFAFCCCDKHHDGKATWGRKCLFHFTAYKTSWNKIRARTQDNNLQVGPEASTTEECILLACLPQIACLALYSAQGYLCRDGTTHSGMDPSTSIINQEKAPQVNLREEFSELRFSHTL